MTQPAVIEAWHRLVQSRDSASLSELLADDVVFHSPVVHTPQRGRPLTELYLRAALKVFFNDSFRYVRELVDGNNAVLEFVVEMDGIAVNGVDMISWNEQGKIVDFKVMLRPLKAINLIHEKMGRMLEARQ
jgi:ketosteroid isomerase-like protein